MKTLRSLILIMTTFTAQYGYTSYFYYKCSEKGELLDSFTTDDTMAYARQLQSSLEKENIYKKTCMAQRECEQNYKRILTLLKAAKNTNKSLTEKDQKIPLNHEIKIPKNDFELMQEIEKLNKETLQCSQKSDALEPDLFLSKPCQKCSERIVLYYPFYNNYMFISGCHKLSTSRCRHVLKHKFVKKSIEKSLIMGADPYTTIAVALMENMRSKELPDSFDNSLIWKKTIPPQTWLSGAMKCHQNKKKSTSSHLGKKIQSFLKNEGVKLKPAKSYFCYKRGRGKAVTSSTPLKHHCCKELPFSLNNKKDTHHIQSAYLFHYIKSLSESPLTCKKKSQKKREVSCQKGKRNKLYEKDPAYNIQRFKGYSSLDGGNEPVSAWRNGVNHFHDPVYGHQILDYLINSLYSNPLLKQMVKDAKEKLKIKTSHQLICQNHKAGNYRIHTHYYFNRGKNATRLKNILDKKEKKWGDLSDRERLVFISELADPKVMYGNKSKGHKGLLHYLDPKDKKLYKHFFSQVKFKNMSNHYESRLQLNENLNLLRKEKPYFSAILNRIKNSYFKNIYPYRNTRGKSSDYPWRRLNQQDFARMIKKFD